MDSLKTLIQSSKGLEKADLFNNISKAYWFSNPDSAFYFGNQALLIAQTMHYRKAEAEAYRNLGMSRMHMAPDQCKPFFDKALSLFISIHDKKGMASTYNNIGSMWLGTRNETSLAYYDSALNIFRELVDKQGEGAVLNYINVVYQKMGDYQKAVDYALLGLDVRKTTNDHEGIIYSYINVGNIYFEGGQYLSALKFYNESVSYAKQHRIEPFDMALDQLGKTYQHLKQYEKAAAYLLKNPGKRDHLAAAQLFAETNRPDSALKEFKISLDIAEQHNDIIYQTGSLIGLSKVFLEKKNLPLSLYYAEQAYHIADSAKYKTVLAEATEILSTIKENTGKYKEALYLSKVSHSIFDSINNKNNENYQQKLAAFESKSEIEKQQANFKILSAERTLQEQRLNSEKLYRKVILIASSIVIILAFVIIRNINRKRKKIQAQKDQIDWQKLQAENAYEELKAAQSQLIRREKMASLGELTAGIAHEIQNPLNFVNNFSEVSMELVEEIVEEETKEKPDGVLVRNLLHDVGQNLQKITHHGKRADAIVKGMLQHSRSNSGKKEMTDVNALVDEYSRLAYHGIRAKEKSFNLAIDMRLDPHIGKINIVAEDIGRVILNLLNNAFYSVMEKKKLLNGIYEPAVLVSTKLISSSQGTMAGSHLEIRIRDNGVGVPENILDKIYYPFFTTKPTGQGTGLGLSLSYDIITKGHSGNLKVETKENEFAEFIIDLPCH